jgi:hypothetical protein
MLPVIERLLALQDRDQKVRAFRNELASLPAETSAREKQLADAAARLASAQTRAKEIEVQKKSLQLEATTKRDAIARYKTQQLQTRKNEEYTALAHEITAAENAVSAIEDREIDLMAEAETLQPQIAAAEKLFAEDKARIAHQLAGLEEKKKNLDTRIAEIVADRTRFTDGLDEDLLERYDRLFKTKNGSAVVPLEHEVCMGCHMKVTTQTVVAVKGEKEVVYCPQRGRILYLPA